MADKTYEFIQEHSIANKVEVGGKELLDKIDSSGLVKELKSGGTRLVQKVDPQAITAKVEGAAGDLYHRIDKNGVIKEKAGQVERALDSVTGQISQKADTIRSAVALASSTMQNDLNKLESGLYSLQSSMSDISAGTNIAGIGVNGFVTLKFDAAQCFHLTQAIKDLLELIAIVKDILTLLGKLLPPGDILLRKLTKKIKLLGNIVTSCGSVDFGLGAATPEVTVGLTTFNVDPADEV